MVDQGVYEISFNLDDLEVGSQRAHGELLLEQLRQQRETDFLCDITIIVGDVPFRAHRNVLAAFSQFFSCVSGSDQQDTTLDPDLVSHLALEKLLEFIYTGEMSLDNETSEVVRRAAAFLGMLTAEQYMDKALHLSRNPGKEEVEEENMPTNPVTPSTSQRGQGRKRVQKPKKPSPGVPTTTSSTADSIADIKTQRGRGRGRGKGRGRGRVEIKREDLSFVISDLQAIKMGRNIPSDLSPSAPSPSDLSSPAKRMRGSRGAWRGRGRGRSKLKENRPSDGEGDEGEEEEANWLQTKDEPTCMECNRVFTEISSLRRHMRIHKGLKPFQCPICPKKFTQKNQLKTHLRIHTGEKPFSCTQCDKSFVQKCQLVSHCRMYHGEEKPYRCEQCGLQFATSSNFKIHYRLHSGERPYVCEDCGKAFAQTSTLIYHRRRHTGEKPYQCDTCGMSFSVSSSLISHSRKHAGDTFQVRPYPCSHCDKSFSSASGRSRHARCHGKGVQKPTLPEPRQIKEEPELWTSEEEDSSGLSFIYQTPIVEDSEDSLPINTIKIEPDG